MTCRLLLPQLCLRKFIKLSRIPLQIIWKKEVRSLIQVEKDFGNEALAKQDGRDLFYPITRGEIQDYRHMKDIWSHLIDQSDKNLSVLISDYPLAKKESKIETAKIMFEQLNV